MTLHIGTVPYCNAFPLIHYLPKHLTDAEITDWIPSTMRNQLADHQLDCALMPIAELPFLFQGKIISNCCIACNGAVRSVLLFCRKPIEHIQTIAMDTASRSSVTICSLILQHFYGIIPEKYRLEQNQHPNDCQADAFVIIGDRALAYQPSEEWHFRYDLGELWKAKTGLPLVFAAWIGCSPQVDDSFLAAALEASRDQGLQNLEAVLEAKERQGIVLPLGKSEILDYYQHAIVYTMGEAEKTSMQYFFDILSQIKS